MVKTQQFIESNIESNNDMTKILLYSTELASNYDDCINNNNISSILDTNKNTLCKIVKYNNPQLCEKSINCIIIAFYMHMYIEINKVCIL
jgi:hypothetical protein